jgi:hypothetical protein
MAKTKSDKPKVNIEKIRSRVEKRIKSPSEFPPNQNVLVYARPKTGKTRFCATAPRCLIIDCDEEGTDSIRDDEETKVIRVKTWSEVNDIYWYLQSGDHNFQSVAIDGITGLQTLCMNFVLGEDYARDTSRDPDQPSQRIYQKISKLMKDQITNYRNLPMNTIFTALPRSRESGEGEEEVIVTTGPNVSPAIASHVEAAVGIIGYMIKRQKVVKVSSKKNPDKKVSKKTYTTRMLVGHSERFTVGDRTGKFGEWINNPDFKDMLAVIYGKEA